MLGHGGDQSGFTPVALSMTAAMWPPSNITTICSVPLSNMRAWRPR